MAKSFNQLLNALPQERRDRIEEHAQEMLLEMVLQDFRQKRHLTQPQLAERLNLQQAAVSKLEGQLDMHVGAEDN
jgi:DNA-binding transcriptional regulator YiaG